MIKTLTVQPTPSVTTSSKRKLLSASIAVSSFCLVGTVTAGVTLENEQGQLYFGGDVELDINAYNTSAAENSVLLDDDVDRDDEFNQTGRILLEVGGERATAAHYARFKVQPLMLSDGGFGLDDAWLALGQQEGWEAKVGRFEGYDLFPLGQDVFVEYNGDTANDLYKDGSGYIYQAKEGRGRGGKAGQVMFSRDYGGLYVEVGTLFGDRSGLFAEDTYHGFDIDEDDAKSSFIVRPVVAYSMNDWTLAAGAETNLVDDATVDERGVDISDRTGYATSLKYSGAGMAFNLNVAFMDAEAEDNLSVGTNVTFQNIGLGYIYAHNDIHEVKPGTSESAEGQYNSHTTYLSYKFEDVLAIEDFHTYIGTFYSLIDHENVDNDSDSDRYGARLRLKYHF